MTSVNRLRSRTASSLAGAPRGECWVESRTLVSRMKRLEVHVATRGRRYDPHPDIQDW